MSIFIDSLQGWVLRVLVNPGDTIDNIKSIIQDRKGNPPDESRLFFDEKQPEDETALRDYGIKDKSTLQHPIRLRGC